MTLRRGEDHEELIEGSEPLQESAERRNGRAVTRQEAENVGVEGEAPESEAREEDDDQQSPQHHRASAMGPSDDELDW